MGIPLTKADSHPRGKGGPGSTRIHHAFTMGHVRHLERVYFLHFPLSIFSWCQVQETETLESVIMDKGELLLYEASCMVDPINSYCG